MSEKVKVQVFGVRDGASGGGCSCGGGCAPTMTMGEMYDEFVRFIKDSDINEKVETEFVDVIEDGLEGYVEALKLLEKGYGLPLTLINGKPRFYGGISNEMFYDVIKKHI